MKKAFEAVSGFFNDFIGLLKVLIIFFIFANILYMTGFDPVAGVIDLVDAFLSGGFAGLIALLLLIAIL